MKKLIIPAMFIMMTAACGTRDNKNELEHYPTYDTNQKQNINLAPEDSSSLNVPKDHGDIN